MAEQDPKQPENEVQDEQTANPEAQLETAEEVAAAEAADAGAEGDTEVSLDDELSQLQEDLLAARDAALRAQADAQNVKRRAEQDVEKARKFALERFASDLLPVVDNLERALEAASGDDEAIKPIAEGVELTLKSFIDVLGKNKVDVVDPQGEPFDPNLHQAITMIENKEVEPNTVTAVMQKGYSLNGRLIRPAMVMVSKGG
ncbi:nucleotide exchange factor GrpE [Halieaceae bacterium IMCC8485]|uniref:Protein GrpE n=1 Tax=Candidatus Seongchinamella marina TaxID=2518990 RepID=A0ABT3SQ33_9GAMM|nr:nucleotide exchange factor GrpE [Candidatus Seongchinamella marina]MCX2972097.1 nucleotide exchange factor GrpE [Candidatus Seongchinamella marina]